MGLLRIGFTYNERNSCLQSRVMVFGIDDSNGKQVGLRRFRFDSSFHSVKSKT